MNSLPVRLIIHPQEALVPFIGLSSFNKGGTTCDQTEKNDTQGEQVSILAWEFGFANQNLWCLKADSTDLVGDFSAEGPVRVSTKTEVPDF